MNCPKCGGDMWDNRERKKNPKAPDFKCKDKDCDGVIWPPRGAKASAPTRSAPKSGNGNDDRSNRIERQHSQEMALRYFAMRPNLMHSTLKPKDAAAMIREMTDWFQKDIARLPSEKQEQSTTRQPDMEDADPHHSDGTPRDAWGDDEPPF